MKRGDVVKKSFNPFRMWGSWVGVVVGLGLVFLASQLKQQSNLIYNFLVPFRILFNFANLGGTVGGAMFTIVGWTVGNIFLGFLIGWGVHSLIRVLSR